MRTLDISSINPSFTLHRIKGSGGWQVVGTGMAHCVRIGRSKRVRKMIAFEKRS